MRIRSRFTLIIFFLTTSTNFFAQEKKLNNELIWSSREFSAEHVYGIRSMEDGEHFTIVENDEVVRYSYPNFGEKRKVILSRDMINNLAIDDYTFNHDESKILIATEQESIYRRSSKANYYIVDLETGKMLYNMALAQADVKDYTGSEINTINAIEILKPLEATKQLYNCYNNLAVVTKELKEFDRAIDYNNMALEYQKQIKGENTYGLTLKNNIGMIYIEQGDFQKAIPYFEEVVADKSVLDEKPKLYALALSNLAYTMLRVNKKVNLTERFEKAIKIQDSIGDIVGLTQSNYNLAQYYLNEQDTVLALITAKKALQYAEISHSNKKLLETLQLLVKLDPKRAISYNREYINLNDSLQQVERQVRNKFARIRFETDEFIAENEVLERQKQLWTGIAIAVLLLGLMSYLIVDQRAKNQKLRFQQEQQAANQEIFNMMLDQKHKVEEGKKLEQKRISQELHDGVLGKMLGARMVLTGLNQKTDPDAEIQRKKAIDALQDVEKEIRAISHELSHAAYLKINNFINSIETLLETVQTTGDFGYTFDYEKEFSWDKLSGDTKINVYRLIQESLQNCVKHAQCEKVAVRLHIVNDNLNVVISDDGKGFKANKGKKGIGMRNIASRVQKLKGQWNIESTLGKGTTVTLIIPLAYGSNQISNLEKQKLTQEV